MSLYAEILLDSLPFVPAVLAAVTVMDRFRQPTYSLGGKCRLPLTRGVFKYFHKCSSDVVGPTWRDIKESVGHLARAHHRCRA